MAGHVIVGYMWLLAAIDGYWHLTWMYRVWVAIGGYRWLLASHMDVLGLGSYWRLLEGWLKPVFTPEYMASAALPTLLSQLLLLLLLMLTSEFITDFESGNPRLIYLPCERSYDQWDDTENGLEG